MQALLKYSIILKHSSDVTISVAYNKIIFCKYSVLNVLFLIQGDDRVKQGVSHMKSATPPRAPEIYGLF